MGKLWNKRGILFALLAGACVLPSAVSGQDVLSVLNATAGVQRFANLIVKAGLLPVFSDPALNLTIFAPTDTALDGIYSLLGAPANQFDQNLASILLYHAVVPAFNASALPAGVSVWQSFGVAADRNLTVNNTGSAVVLKSVGSDAVVTRADIQANKSVIHVIDAVLLPFYPNIESVLRRRPELSTLYQVATIPGLPSFLPSISSPYVAYTLFAPSNDAFSALLADRNTSLEQLAASPGTVLNILQYHLLRGGFWTSNNIGFPATSETTLADQAVLLERQSLTVRVLTPSGNATVTTRDIRTNFNLAANATYAVVHIIDRVLIPPPVPTVMAGLSGQVNDNAAFRALLAKLGPFASLANSSAFRGTVFAPTGSSVWAPVWERNGSVEQILDDSAVLTSVVQLHFVPDVVLTVAGLVDGQQLTTYGGPNTLTVDRSTAPGVVRIVAGQGTAGQNASSVIRDAELPIGNGQASIIFIDRLLLPANAFAWNRTGAGNSTGNNTGNSSSNGAGSGTGAGNSTAGGGMGPGKSGNSTKGGDTGAGSASLPSWVLLLGCAAVAMLLFGL